MTGVIREDVLLTDGCYGGETGFRAMYSFRISMNRVAGVEILEARWLITGVSVG